VVQERQVRRVVGRLPAEVTSFVDRRTELAELRRLLTTGRLVTLTGIGGAGKTRLALRVATTLRRAYPDGIWFVELGALSDGELVAYAVVEALNLPGASELPAARLLADHLAARQLMLVLDNCEHLVGACAELAVALLGRCPGLRVLCTSRQPLGVTGESVFTVPPLAVPTDGKTPVTVDQSSPALRLFVERAAAAAPGFALGSQNEPVVAEICTRLDGLPLAIELAAARLRTLTVEQLAAGLADRFKVLAARHAAQPWHRRLGDTFSWSFELCSSAEQTLWGRLAVFGGGFDLDAAVAVCASDDLPGETMLAVLSGLVDKSIVIRAEQAGRTRYRLLETVREYGLSRLPAGDGLAVLKRRHRDWYLRLAERFDAEWFGPDQVRWAGRMHAEHANLRTAMGWCLATPGEAESGLRLVTALWFFWIAYALPEGRLWLERMLAADPRPTLTRGLAMSARTRVLISQADHAAAEASAGETLALARTLSDPLLLAKATFDAAATSFMRGDDPVLVQAPIEDAVAGFAALGTAPFDHAMALLSLHRPAMARGDWHRADQVCTQVRELCQRRGDRWWLAYTWLASAEVAFRRDASAEGEGYVQQALRLHHLLGNSHGMLSALEDLAYAAATDGDPERAACLLGAASTLAEPLGQDPVRRRRYWDTLVTAPDGVRAALGRSAFDAAFERGQRMGLDRAVRYALRAEQVIDETPIPPAPSPARARIPLTRREFEVAELISRGLSNHQIATRLVISRRTAESHVENILRKLGFTSRAQVANWVIRQHAELG
jgi:non-specific serine/threonine protein kinase